MRGFRVLQSLGDTGRWRGMEDEEPNISCIIHQREERGEGMRVAEERKEFQTYLIILLLCLKVRTNAHTHTPK